MLTRILLADEHRGLRPLLDEESDFEVVAEANSVEAMMRLVRETVPDVVILDLGMTALKGLDMVRQLVEAAPAVKVIVLCIYGDRNSQWKS